MTCWVPTGVVGGESRAVSERRCTVGTLRRMGRPSPLKQLAPGDAMVSLPPFCEASLTWRETPREACQLSLRRTRLSFLPLGPYSSLSGQADGERLTECFESQATQLRSTSRARPQPRAPMRPGQASKTRKRTGSSAPEPHLTLCTATEWSAVARCPGDERRSAGGSSVRGAQTSRGRAVERCVARSWSLRLTGERGGVARARLWS